MKKLLIITALALMACGGVTGPEMDNPIDTRVITYEFTGDARFIQYAEWRIRDGVCENYSNKELPFTVEASVDASQLCVYVSKYSEIGTVVVSAYEHGEYIGGCTCTEGRIDAIWIEGQ